MKGSAQTGVVLLAASTMLVGCGASARKAVPSVTPAAPPPVAQAPAPAPPPEDPVASLVASSQQRFRAGQQEFALGHLDRAKVEFDRSIDLLLESPYGVREDARIREQFERLIDRIAVYELTALAQGDGFTEQRYAAASIDELLALPAPAESAPEMPALKETVESDLANTAHDIPIPLNQRVLAYIDVFQGRLRDWFTEGVKRGAQYLPMIQDVLRAEGLPLDLAYLPLIESAFQPTAVSRAQAKGFWQFMRGTGLDHGLRQNWYVDERSDPEKATKAAAKYLKTLRDLFDGDWHLALASYNGGPGRLQNAVKRSGRTDFWDLASSSRYLPRETREYVPMFLAAIVIARNPALYGFDLIGDPVEATSVEKVTTTRPLDLRRVAEWTGKSVNEIQALNPELRRWTTPAREPSYDIKVPADVADTLRTRLDDSTAADMATFQYYTVKRGDTLPAIAAKLRVGRSDLAEANSVSSKAKLMPGQQLIVPRAPATLLAARTESQPAEPAVTTARAERGVLKTAESTAVAKNESSSSKDSITYRVRNGDSLYSIAQRHDTTVRQLMAWNNLRTTQIRPGDRLRIYR